MPFVSRNERGAITGVFGRKSPIAREELDAEHPELRAFLHGPGARHVRGRLLASDTEMARIAEDILRGTVGGSVADMVVVNAAAGISAGSNEDLGIAEAIPVAREALADGGAYEKLQTMRVKAPTHA